MLVRREIPAAANAFAPSRKKAHFPSIGRRHEQAYHLGTI